MNVYTDDGRLVAHLDMSTVENPEHAVTREQLSAMDSCPKCGAPPEPEPSDMVRALILHLPDFTWHPPEGQFFTRGFGLMGGGYGPYAICDGCGFFAKHDLGPEAE